MSDLRVSPEEAILLMTGRISALQPLKGNTERCGYYDAVGWCSETYAVIDRVYGSGNIKAEEIRMMGLPGCSCSTNGQSHQVLDLYAVRLMEWIDEIRAGMRDE